MQSPFSPLAPLVPLASLASHCTLFTYLAPSSCDRNRPPPSQVNCKLTLFAPPFHPLSHPSLFPRTPTVQHLITTILGPIRSSMRNNYKGRKTYLLPFIDISRIEEELVVQAHVTVAPPGGPGSSTGAIVGGGHRGRQDHAPRHHIVREQNSCGDGNGFGTSHPLRIALRFLEGDQRHGGDLRPGYRRPPSWPFFFFFFGAFASVGLVVHEFGRDPAYRVSIYSRNDLHFWGCRAGFEPRTALQQSGVLTSRLHLTPENYKITLASFYKVDTFLFATTRLGPRN